MGVIEDIQTRVTTLERRMDDHDTTHIRIERRIDQLVGDVSQLKGDVSQLKGDVSTLKTDMEQVKVRVEVIPELMAGQVELREMVAKLLAWSEAGGRS
ncbi:YbgF trimerization domain-containing protein [Actinoallomurus sp. NPDC052308]|uniref:DUF1515 family protein n=1 Tax=Actinoallomurus sp. NPDC052308 TaxID=3155530 RepID=UPI0034333431